ncbi:MAG: glutamate--tRNA ligase [Parvibaculales bacterium]
MSSTPPITRFAPSPTGFLHIGGARTALFNWAFAHHFGGKFLLRIEDTDRSRSTDEAKNAIFSSLKWLGLEWDDEAIFQHERAERHKEIADELLKTGNAYRCTCTAEEIAAMREAAKKKGLPPRYDGTCRDKEHGAEKKHIVRFKSPQNGQTIIEDSVQGKVVIENSQFDDLIILRSDGTPTYMLSVVVDDYDMGITHILRGDDHLTNAGRQSQIYMALGWNIPHFSHIPLIHGSDGAKLSKRHGALSVEAYKEMGILPDAMCNYLARLGWSHGDDEIFSREQFVKWFTMEGLNRSPSRFDMAKLTHINGLYIRNAPAKGFIDPVSSELSLTTEEQKDKLASLIPSLQERAKTLHDIAEGAKFLFAQTPLTMDTQAKKTLDKPGARKLLGALAEDFENISNWQAKQIEEHISAFLQEKDLKLGALAQPLRAALTGGSISVGIYDMLAALGKKEAISRIHAQAVTGL